LITFKKPDAVASENPIQLTRGRGESEHDRHMIAIGAAISSACCATASSRDSSLQAEILVLRINQRSSAGVRHVDRICVGRFVPYHLALSSAALASLAP